MVDRTRELEYALGDGNKIVEPNETETVVIQRRWIRATSILRARDDTRGGRSRGPQTRTARRDLSASGEARHGPQTPARRTAGRLPQVDRPRLKVLYISRGYSTHDRRFLTSFVNEGWATSHLPILGERLDERPLPDTVETLKWTPDLSDPLRSEDWIEREQRLRAVLAERTPDVVIAGPVQSGAYLAALAGANPS